MVLPILLLLLLGTVQAALIVLASEIVQGCAFSAARAALVEEDAEKAGALACVPITGRSMQRVPARTLPEAAALGPDDHQRFAIGYGALGKTRVSLMRRESAVEAVLTHSYELLVPVVNRLLSVLLPASVSPSARYGAPHLLLSARVELVREGP